MEQSCLMVSIEWEAVATDSCLQIGSAATAHGHLQIVSVRIELRHLLAISSQMYRRIKCRIAGADNQHALVGELRRVIQLIRVYYRALIMRIRS